MKENLSKDNNFIHIRNGVFSLLIAYALINILSDKEIVKHYSNSLFELLKPFLIAFTIAYLVNPIANLFESKLKINRFFSTLLSYTIFLLVLIFFVFLIGPIIVNNIVDIIKQIPMYINQIENILESVLDANTIEYLYPIFLDFLENIKNLLPTITSFIANSLSQAVNTTINIVSSVMNSFVTTFLSFYIVLERDKILSFFNKLTYALVGPSKHSLLRELIVTLNTNIGKYFASKMLDSMIVGLISAIVLTFVGSKYSLLLGFIMIFANMIPYFGPIIGMIPAVIINLFYNPTVSLYCIIGLFIVQQLETVFIEPKIVGKNLNLSPFLTLTSISIGGSLFGILGMILSIPVMGVIKIYVERFINDKNKTS